MKTDTTASTGFTRAGTEKKGSLGVSGGGNSGMVKRSNCEIKEMVILRYVGMMKMRMKMMMNTDRQSEGKG